MGDLFLAAVNARGLKQNMKRLAMFHCFKQQHYDNICLQETHLTKQDIPTHTWQNKMLLYGELWSKYYLVIHLMGEGTDVVNVNVYAPNLKAEN